MENDYNCYICLKLERSCAHSAETKDGRWLSKKGISTLLERSKERNDSLHQNLDISTKVWVPNACYKEYTDRRKSENKGEELFPSVSYSTKSRKGISFDYMTHCLICEEILDFDKAKKRPDRIRYQISTIDWIDNNTKKSKLHETLLSFCEGKTDPLAIEVASKIAYAGCLRASQAKYHRDCMQRFLSGVSVTEVKASSRNFSEAKNRTFEKFCHWYESHEHETILPLTLFDVQKRMEEFTDDGSDIYTIKQINRKLLERYGDSVRLTSSSGLPSIMLLQEEADNIVVENLLDNSKGSLNEDLQQILEVGKTIKECLREDDARQEFYPYAGDLTLDKLSADIPETLRTLLDTIFTKSRTETAQRKKDLRKTAVGHAMMQWCKKEGYLSPLLLSVGLFIHQVTRSCIIIDVPFSLGYSVSYSDVIAFEKSAAVSTIQFDQVTTQEESEAVFLQFIGDNFDHNEDTTTGGDTTHVMGVISSEFPKSEFSKTQPIEKEYISAGSMIETARLREIVKAYEKPYVSRFKKIKLRKLLSSNLDITCFQKLDTFWHVSGLFMENPPNWQGFMAGIIHGTALPSQISFHPIIPLDPSSYEAVYSTLVFVNEQIKQKKLCCTSLTFDQPLYWKACEIKEDKSPELDSLHLKLGGFHQLMGFMGAGCHLMEDAGLKEVWSTVYKENSLPKMMEGKAYSRCLRACLLTDAALHFILLLNDENHDSNNCVYEPTDTFDEFEELIDLDGNIFENLSDEDIDCSSNGESEEEKSLADILLEKFRKDCNRGNLLTFSEDTVEHLAMLYKSLLAGEIGPEHAANDPVINNIHDTISSLKFLQDLKRTGKLWVQFMDFTSIIRMFIRAERTGNWDLHLYASEQMLPFFAAAGHNKYVKAVRKYLQDANNLCDCLKRKYNEGLFTIWRKDKLFWSGTFTDQVIEQELMLSGKTGGGLINITHRDAARTKWLLSAHIVANYSQAIRDLTGVTSGTFSEQHREMRESNRKENYRHLRSFIDFFDVYNPFQTTTTRLINVATGVVATDEVNVENAVDVGKEILDKMDDRCLGDITLKKKDQAKTFAVMRKSMKIDDKEVRISSEELSQRLLSSVIRGGPPLSEIFSFELSAVAPSLFFDNGQMRRNNKAELMNELLVLGKVQSYEESSYHVFDGCAWFFHIPWPKLGKILDLYELFLQSLNRENGAAGAGISVIFDSYTSETTKGPEQKRRKQSGTTLDTAAEINVNISTPIPPDRQQFLSNKKNKQNLIDLFSSMLMREGVIVKHALRDGDADTLIVKESLDKSGEYNVIVHSLDTDVFITLLYHTSEKEKNDIVMTTKQGLASITTIASSISFDMKNCLPVSHAISGCDTVSSTFGVGKLKAYRKLNGSTKFQKLLANVGKQDVDLDTIVSSAEVFFMQLYGKRASKATSLNHLRELLYTFPRYIPISRMPPTSRAFHFHMLRVHLQVNTWMSLGQTLNAEEHGFKKDDSGHLIPIITDKPAAPRCLFKEIKCSCQKPNQAGLLCTGCGCRKSGLSCTDLCKCNKECEND